MSDNIVSQSVTLVLLILAFILAAIFIYAALQIPKILRYLRAIAKITTLQVRDKVDKETLHAILSEADSDVMQHFEKKLYN